MLPFIETRTGGEFWPLDPKPADVDIEDIAHALSNQCRFSGHTRVHYSVAEHSVRVARLLASLNHGPFTQMWGLLHDASEAYLVDLPSPLKRDPRLAFYVEAEAAVMRAVCARFELASSPPPCIAVADATLLATEVRDLMHPNSGHWGKLTAEPLRERIYPWAPHTARATFLTTFEQIRKAMGR